MNTVRIAQVTNAEVYWKDNLLIGRFKEINLADLETTDVKHETLGQVVVVNLPGRPLKELKGKISIQSWDKELMRDIYNPTKVVRLTLHSFVDVFDSDGLNVGDGYRVITNIGVLFKKFGGKAIKIGDNVEGDADVVFTLFKQTVSTEEAPLVEIDVMQQIYRANGVDVFPRY